MVVKSACRSVGAPALYAPTMSTYDRPLCSLPFMGTFSTKRVESVRVAGAAAPCVLCALSWPEILGLTGLNLEEENPKGHSLTTVCHLISFSLSASRTVAPSLSIPVVSPSCCRHATIVLPLCHHFVIYLGDVITANNIMIANASLYWDQAISPTQKRGITWASVFGNHDDAAFEWPLEWFSAPGIPQISCPPTGTSYSGEEECSFKGTGRLEMMKNEINHNGSFSSSGPRNLWPSVSNYVLEVSSLDDPQSPVAFLYFFDSGGGSYPEVISSGQADWFLQKAEEINSDSRVPEIIFWHIPSTAYKAVAPKHSIQKPCVGSINKESVAPQEAETGIMNLLVNRSSVKAIFVGHNHGLDWCCPYKKLWLCYARHTGYGGYGDWPRGARILEITQKPFSLRSWIRMEDGQVHSEVVLS